MAIIPTAEVDALLSSSWPGWNLQNGLPQVVTYSFAQDGSGLNLAGNYNPLGAGQWAPLTPAQQASARQALAAWSAVSGLIFVEVPDQPAGFHVDIRFRLQAGFPSNIVGAAYYPPIGEIALDLKRFGGDAMAPGSYGYYTLLHEIGHAVGLKHPFQGYPILSSTLDNTDQTVMSYTVGPSGTPAHLGPLDVQAVQYIYGTTAAETAMGLRSHYDKGQDRVVIATSDGTQMICGVDYREVIQAGNGARTIFGGNGDSIIYGGAGGQTIFAGNGPNHVYGGTGNDTIHGGAGDDWLAGGLGDNTINGYQGVNTLGLGTARWAVALTKTAGLAGTAADGHGVATWFGTASAPGETERFQNITNFAFADGRLVFDSGDPAAKVMRLYDAALGRAPDGSGLHNWTVTLQAGTNLHDVAMSFVTSPEFAVRYGAPDNTGFVTLLYQNTLHRSPDAAGLANWVNALAMGQLDRAGVLLGFSESVEHQNLAAAQVTNGLWDPDPTASSVARLYLTAFLRKPDLPGLLNWTGAEKSGLSPHAAADGFLHSAEFAARYGTPDDTGFVNLLYDHALGREPDAGGLAFWTNALATGAMDRGDILLGFAESNEAQARFAPVIEGGITFA